MLETDRETEISESEGESSRLAALASTGILDSEPEPCYDAITRLCAEYFEADMVLISFADESRLWIKSCVGPPVRELPRKNSVFDMVLARNRALMVPDLANSLEKIAGARRFKQLGIASFGSAPIRTAEGCILGNLTFLCRIPRPDIGPHELRTLENLAEMASSQLELRRVRRAFTAQCEGRCMSDPKTCPNHHTWPREDDLRLALERNELVLHYQPEVELSTRRIIGLEALVRWRHPQRGLIPPAQFIHVAEESGLILQIGDWGIAEACGQIQEWCKRDSRWSSLRVCVNLSARQFMREGLADHVEALLLQYGISGPQLGLEVTESSLIPNMGIALTVLGRLRRLGVSLLMDDFGTGYSSLSYLHSFPFDVLKIDRSFVGRMNDGDQAFQIIRTIIDLARVLGMDVVAEGVETCEQYRLLRQLGCRFGQGFLFAKPMIAADVTALLRLHDRILPDPEAAETLRS
jgi:EAL domain-containing protein (putative c-di-GMP-specific phosphodiesterase class I)